MAAIFSSNAVVAQKTCLVSPPLVNEKCEILDPSSEEGKRWAEYVKQETLREIREIEKKNTVVENKQPGLNA